MLDTLQFEDLPPQAPRIGPGLLPLDVRSNKSLGSSFQSPQSAPTPPNRLTQRPNTGDDGNTAQLKAPEHEGELWTPRSKTKTGQTWSNDFVSAEQSSFSCIGRVEPTRYEYEPIVPQCPDEPRDQETVGLVRQPLPFFQPVVLLAKFGQPIFTCQLSISSPTGSMEATQVFQDKPTSHLTRN